MMSTRDFNWLADLAAKAKAKEEASAPLYLESMVNWLHERTAIDYMRKGWVTWKCDDGTYSAAKLTDKPVQPGQYPWERK